MEDVDRLKRQIDGLSTQMESMFHKISLNSDQLEGIAEELRAMDILGPGPIPISGGKSGNSTETKRSRVNLGEKAFQALGEDTRAQINQVYKEIARLKDEIQTRDIEYSKKFDEFSVSGPQTNQTKQETLVSGEDPKKMREFIKMETEHIYDFIKEFVNEIALSHIRSIQSRRKGTTDKMESLDWMTRNNEFVSPKLFARFVRVCHDIYDKSGQEKTAMYFADHDSDVLLNIRDALLEAIKPNTNEMVKGYLPNYLEALEIALLNEYNQERGVEIGIHDIMITVITGEVDEGVSLRAEKCMSILLAKDTLIQKCVGKTVFVKWLANCLRKKNSDIILAESRLNILAMAFKSTPVTENILKHNNNLANEVVKQLRSSKASNAVLEANVQAFYNFSTCSTLLDYITPPEVLETVIEIANEVPINKLKQTLYKGLNNFVKKQKFLELIQKSGMLEVIRNTTI